MTDILLASFGALVVLAVAHFIYSTVQDMEDGYTQS